MSETPKPVKPEPKICYCLRALFGGFIENTEEEIKTPGYNKEESEMNTSKSSMHKVGYLGVSNLTSYPLELGPCFSFKKHSYIHPDKSMGYGIT